MSLPCRSSQCPSIPIQSHWAKEPTSETRHFRHTASGAVQVRHGGRRVVFLSDAFARYIEPETEQAALDVLSACGFDIHVLPILGAGASFLSKGFIDQARAHAARVLDLLNQTDPKREAIVVGIEPPEIYAFKHDYIDLLPQRAEEIKSRVAHVWLLDEFLVRSTEFHRLRVANLEQSNSSKRALPARKLNFHPHCHQRAQGPSPDGLQNGTSATVELLRSCGYELELMDTGCCGMAGTFGYEAEHYELSMKVGELKLFPKIREWTSSPPINGRPPNPQSNLKSLSKASTADLEEVPAREVGIVSSGAACRMQIEQGTGVSATHPIVLVAKLVNEWRSNDKR